MSGNQIVFQFIIRQWDKGQLSSAHLTKRAALPDRYPIQATTAFTSSGKGFIFSQHGDDIPTNIFSKGRIHNIKRSDNQISFDRFRVSLVSDQIFLEYLAKDSEPVTIGNPEDGWLQCRYHWRYGVEESGQFYWMYEDVILNVVKTDTLDVDVFLKSEPTVIFNGV